MEYEPTKEEIEHARYFMTIYSWDMKRHRHHYYPYWHPITRLHDWCRKQNNKDIYLTDWEIISELKKIRWESEKFRNLQKTEGN